ncbi:MAG: hypothetical protein KDA91_20975 [Planctomycetaceae bacterium]|nr:hypothetical protein [Planctomycetaceae bacterium]
MEVVYVISAIVGFVLIAIYLSSHFEKKRTEAMMVAAESLGFEFTAALDEPARTYLSRTELFSRGRGNKACNYLRRSTDEVDVVIFDHQYTVGSGKSSQTHKQTVVSIQSSGLNLPAFAISPEHFLHKFATALGYQDIDFAQYPRFSAAFLLRGPNETEIREKLEAVDLERIADFPGISIEAKGDHLLLWYGSRRSKPGDVRKLFETAFEIYVLLRD